MDSEKSVTVPTPSNGASADVFCILSSLPLLPPKPSRKCLPFGLGPTCHLSTLNLHCIPGAGLPNHMKGEVSWDPKRRRSWASYSIQSSLVPARGMAPFLPLLLLLKHRVVKLKCYNFWKDELFHIATWPSNFYICPPPLLPPHGTQFIYAILYRVYITFRDNRGFRVFCFGTL
jgi:hypothetical protein